MRMWQRNCMLSTDRELPSGPMTYNAIDYTRFVLICLVILVHIVNFSALYPGAQQFINRFFMQAFLLITGYLMNVDKRVGKFASYLVKIFLPYAAMTLGYAFVSTLLPVRDGIEFFTPDNVLKILLVKPIGPYWYFHTMMICSTLYYIADRCAGRYGKRAVFCLATSLYVAAAGTSLVAYTHALFFLLGAGVRLIGREWDKLFRPTFWAFVPFAVCTAFYAFGRTDTLAVFILAFSFLSFVPKATAAIRSGKCQRCMGYIGRNTLPIYLFHPIFTMGAKYLLPLFGFDPSGVLHIVVTIVSGVAGSLLIAYFMDKTKLSYCFGRENILRSPGKQP